MIQAIWSGNSRGIDGVGQDRADAHDAVPGFEVAPGVPCDRGDAVPELDAVAIKPLRDLSGARVANFGRNWYDEWDLRPTALTTSCVAVITSPRVR